MRYFAHIWSARVQRGAAPKHAQHNAPAASPATNLAKRRTLVGVGIAASCVAVTLAPVSGMEYTVAPGDALSSIADRHDVSVDQIVEANGLEDPDYIVAGTPLRIPSQAGTAAGTTAASHTVAPGDTLWDIASTYGVPLGALAKLNNVGADAIIHPRQTLALPGADAGLGETVADTASPSQDTPAPADATPKATSSGPSTHTVSAGESPWSIANRWGVSVDDLLAVNAMTRGDVIRVGQTLTMPGHGTTSGELTNLPADLANSTERMALMPVFDYWANEYSVPADLLKSLTWFESGWNNTKVSSADAIGIGQILPITAGFVSEYLVGEELDPWVPEQNIQLSARYLRYLLDHAGSVELAVASYYQGLTATRQHGIYSSSEFYVEGILAMRERFR